MKIEPDEQEEDPKKYLTRQEMDELDTLRIAGNTNAGDSMILSVQDLIASIADNFLERGDPDFQDAIQEGFIGVIKSLEKYEHSHPSNAQFHTYTYSRIYHHIAAFKNNGRRMVEVNPHIQTEYRKIKSATISLENKLGRPVTDEEVAKQLGIPAKRIAKVKSWIGSIASLDAPLSEGAGSEDTAHSLTRDIHTCTPFQLAAVKDDGYDGLRQLKALAEYISKRFSKRNFGIFCRCFGLFGHGLPKNLEEIGDHFDLTKERVRQIYEEIFQHRANYEKTIRNTRELIGVISLVTSSFEAFLQTEGSVPLDFLHAVSGVSYRYVAVDKIIDSIKQFLQTHGKMPEEIIPKGVRILQYR